MPKIRTLRKKHSATLAAFHPYIQEKKSNATATTPLEDEPPKLVHIKDTIDYSTSLKHIGEKSNKIKQQIAAREAARMKEIQQDPSFIKDPLAVLRSHIQARLRGKKEPLRDPKSLSEMKKAVKKK